ncbi:TolC family protein [bacterium]|nr:TolC family protein [bacterium]
MNSPTRLQRAAGCALACLCTLSVLWSPGRAATTLTLDTALETAFGNSPDILSTKLDLERSSELLRAQQAALKSQFSLTLNPITYSRDKTFNPMFSVWSSNDSKSTSSRFTISQPLIQTDGTLKLTNTLNWQNSISDYNEVRNKSYTNNLLLSYTQPLFTYNRTKLATRRLELSLETTRLAYGVQRLSIERQVTQAFYNVYESKLSLEIAREELANRQASYDIIRNKVEGGLAARQELYQAEVDLSSSRSTVQSGEMQLANNLDRFKLLIGIPLDEEITVEADVTWQPVEVDLKKALDHGLTSRMELRQRDIDIENAKFDLTETEAQNEFRGDMTVNYGIKGNDESFSNMYDKPTRNQGVSLQFDIPLWDWGEKNHRVKASMASIRKTRLSSDNQRNNITIGVREAYRSLQNSATQIDLAELGVKNAQLTYEIDLERYKNGDLTSMDLNLSQNQLSQKKIARVQALIDYRLALLNLKIESLYDFEKNHSVLNDIETDPLGDGDKK